MTTTKRILQGKPASVLQGKVAKVLNERELVINLGSEATVAEGTRFAVLEGSSEIKDPDSGEVLGTLEREKIRVEVSEVWPRFCVARTYETFRGLDFFGTSPREVTQVRTFRWSGGPTFLPLEPSESIVQIGDPVEEVYEEPSTAPR